MVVPFSCTEGEEEEVSCFGRHGYLLLLLRRIFSGKISFSFYLHVGYFVNFYWMKGYFWYFRHIYFLRRLIIFFFGLGMPFWSF